MINYLILINLFV